MRRGESLGTHHQSLTPTALIVAGAVVFVLGTGFLLASDATLASANSGASGDLAQAGRWLQFVAWACLLAAVCFAGWEAIVRSEWVAGAEIAAAALGTLLLMIAMAALAASNGSSAAAAVTGAVGIGVWALLVLSRAARLSLTEQGPAQAVHSTVQGGRRHEADLAQPRALLGGMTTSDPADVIGYQALLPGGNEAVAFLNTSTSAAETVRFAPRVPLAGELQTWSYSAGTQNATDSDIVRGTAAASSVAGGVTLPAESMVIMKTSRR